VTREDETEPQPDFKEGELSDRPPCGGRLMTELEVRREIIYAMDECKYNGKPLREYIDSGIGVETFASQLTWALKKNGALKLDD
jgi:hypothetical protein